MAGFLLVSTAYKPKIATTMKRITILTAMILVLGFFLSCSNRNQVSMKRNVTGKLGELVVVIAPSNWEGQPGEKIREILAQPQLGLPQEEAIFDLIKIPHEAFGDIFKTSRNLMVTNIGSGVETSEVLFKRDVHAHTQAVVYVNAKSSDELVSLLNKNSDRIAGFFIQAERDRLQLNYSNYNEKAVSNKTKEVFGLTLNVPPGFKVAEQSDDFMWIRYETPEISQGILIYSFPYDDDSTFTSEYLVAKRNVVLKNNVPGPVEGSYMTTEREVPLLFNVFKRNGNYSAEMRGLWKVENDFMGGPFISLSMLDLLGNRVLTLDAYVYAPGKDKLPLIRQVEAMIYSAAFINQDEIDKINVQFEE